MSLVQIRLSVNRRGSPVDTSAELTIGSYPMSYTDTLVQYSLEGARNTFLNTS